MSCVTHCWHSSHSGAWLGVTPPPMVCCHCGKTPESLHGPYRPHGSSVGGTTITTSTSEAATPKKPTLLFDTKTGPVGQSLNGVHGTYLPSTNLLNE